MGNIILGWQLSKENEDGEINNIIREIKNRYQPLFKNKIEHVGIWNRTQGLLHFNVQPPKDDPYVYFERNRLICYTGKPSITSGDSAFGGEKLNAISLYRKLSSASDVINPASINEINPPFTFILLDAENNKLSLINDGLGYDQFFICETKEGVIFSNKCWPIIKLLGNCPDINYSGWKYWFTLGWFSDNSTPFVNIRTLNRGEFIKGDGKNITIDRIDAFNSWIDVSKSPKERTQFLIRAGNSFNQMIHSNTLDGLSVSSDLTGGVDTRSICSLIIKERIPCTFYTNGPRFSTDVIIAKKIEKKFNLELKTSNYECKKRHLLNNEIPIKFEKLILWCEGLVEPNRFMQFSQPPAEPPFNNRPRFSGSSGDISKAHYYRYWLNNGVQSFNKIIKWVFDDFNKIKDSIIYLSNSFDVEKMLENHIFSGKVYGLKDFELLDFFYLNERIGRWESAHTKTNLFDAPNIIPFMNIDHIKIAFLLTPQEKSSFEFQKFIIKQNKKELLDIPINNDIYKIWRHRFVKSFSGYNLFNKLFKNFSWEDFFRREGRMHIYKVLSNDNSPLWQIIDKSKAKIKCSNFLENKDNDFYFILRLISFDYWYNIFIK